MELTKPTGAIRSVPRYWPTAAWPKEPKIALTTPGDHRAKDADDQAADDDPTQHLEHVATRQLPRPSDGLDRPGAPQQQDRCESHAEEDVQQAGEPTEGGDKDGETGAGDRIDGEEREDGRKRPEPSQQDECERLQEVAPRQPDDPGRERGRRFAVDELLRQAVHDRRHDGPEDEAEHEAADEGGDEGAEKGVDLFRGRQSRRVTRHPRHVPATAAAGSRTA